LLEQIKAAIKMGRQQGARKEHIVIDTRLRSNAAAAPFSSQPWGRVLGTSSALSLSDGRRIRSVLVGIDYPRRRMVLLAQRFGEEALSGRCVAFSRQMEVDRRTDESTAR
jgi:hypothetical protein